MPKITFLGHACFLIENETHRFLFDPYLNNNPQAAASPADLDPSYIFVSHGHFDHLGDAFTIAQRSGATIISTTELVKECEKHGVKGHAMNIGTKHNFDFGYVRLTPAIHHAGIPGGHACGFIVNIHGYKIYFAGDTSLFGDMKLYGDIERVDLCLLPIGGFFTMDIDDAVFAAKLVGAKTVIPYHYNTWPQITADPQEFEAKVATNTSSRCLILEPGQSVNL